VGDGDDGAGVRCRWCSSQATVSASRWLVGSSSSRMSGFCSSSRHRATRRFSPPERTRRGCRRRAAQGVHGHLQRESRSQASRWSSFSCTSPGGRELVPSRHHRVRRRLVDLLELLEQVDGLLHPSSTTSRTVLSDPAAPAPGSRRCSRGERMVSPLNSLSTPARMRSSELLPEPFRPSTPILAP
jgi:hypothetical protein